MSEPILAVIVPTRQRPTSIVPLLGAFADTCRADTRLVLAIDGCPQEQSYRAEVDSVAGLFPTVVWAGPRRRLVGTLNHHALALATAPGPPYAIAYMGDDHRPRTVGWDRAYLDALKTLGSGLVYGDDGIQGADLPTQVAVTADIVAALGYLAPPPLVHMYCDNYWRDLGLRADCLTYLPQVRVEHLHPCRHPAAWDDSYRESNAAAQYAQDRAAYTCFVDSGALDRDVDTIRALRGDL